MLFGIEPETIVGFGSSSFVPWPNESSFAPVGWSALVSTPARKALPEPSASQSMQVPPPSTFRFASVSISKLLLSRTLAVLHSGAAPATRAPDSKNTDAPASATMAASSSTRLVEPDPLIDFNPYPMLL